MNQDFLQINYQYLLNNTDHNHPNPANLWVLTLVASVFKADTLASCTQMLAQVLPDYTLIAQTTATPENNAQVNNHQANSPQTNSQSYASLEPHSQTSPVTTLQWLIESKNCSTESHKSLIQNIREALADGNHKRVQNGSLDINIMPFAHYCRPHKLALFDMDSTLIEQEVIVELAKKAGIGEKVNAITEAAMRGEMDFSESFTQRVALLQGLSTAVLDDIIRDNISFSLGAKRLITALKNAGFHVVLVSGGFSYFAEYVQKVLGIDEIYANDLDIANGMLTGKITSPIVDGKRKAEILQEVATRLSIDLSETVAVGDGANDLPMLGLADIGVAYRAKPIVQAQADYAVNVAGLDGVMAVLGLK